jgi:hypothetical protein
LTSATATPLGSIVTTTFEVSVLAPNAQSFSAPSRMARADKTPATQKGKKFWITARRNATMSVYKIFRTQ